MQVQMKCQKRFLKPGHRNPFLRILLACGDNGIFTTLWIQVNCHASCHSLVLSKFDNLRNFSK